MYILLNIICSGSESLIAISPSQLPIWLIKMVIFTRSSPSICVRDVFKKNLYHNEISSGELNIQSLTIIPLKCLKNDVADSKRLLITIMKHGPIS